jgi:toxin HigB-1
MEVRYLDERLGQLESDPGFLGEWPPGIVKAFRKRMNFVRQATDERDLYAWRSLHVEKLKGERKDEYSLRLNDQWRLVFLLEGMSNGKVFVVVSIEDYH